MPRRNSTPPASPADRRRYRGPVTHGPPASDETPGPGGTDALIALGGNLGDVSAAFFTTLNALHAIPGVRVTAASRAYRTPAVGVDAGGAFLNAAATLRTTLAPHALLDALQWCEAAAGRKPGVRWGPRPLDLDLILYGDRRIDEDRLTVPHPALGWRRFVLDPACEVAGDWSVPGGGRLRDLRTALLARPLRIGVGGADDALRRRLRAELGPAFRATFERREPGVSPKRPPTALRIVRGGGGERRADVVTVPADPAAAVAAVREVLEAALPAPEPAPVGGAVRTPPSRPDASAGDASSRSLQESG